MSKIKEDPQGEENTPEQETPEGMECQKDRHVLGEIAGGICLASTMVSCLSLFLVAMVGLV
ncbi:MAG: hypothetical protein U5L76_00745 [Patescibacteria group bacterium]|nr:hypothetical protein [Patescibacteria group bacterium]